MRQLFPAPGI